MNARKFRKLLEEKGACSPAVEQFEYDRLRWHLSVEKTLTRWLRIARGADILLEPRAAWLCWPWDSVERDVSGRSDYPMLRTEELVRLMTPKKIISLIRRIKPDTF